jgi:hypothetical protein
MPPIRAVTRQPNVVFILADDVGWADVPWNNRNLRYLKTLYQGNITELILHKNDIHDLIA